MVCRESIRARPRRAIKRLIRLALANVWLVLAGLALPIAPVVASDCYDKTHIPSSCPDQGIAKAEAEAAADAWIARNAQVNPIPPYSPYKRCPTLLTINQSGAGNYIAPFQAEGTICPATGGAATSYAMRFFPAACSTRPPIISPPGANGARQCSNGCEYAKQGATATPTGNTCELPAIDPGKNNTCCSTTTGPVTVGNPVNMFTGAKLEAVDDYVDPAGKLSLRRYYSSALVPTNAGSVMGARWRHAFQLGLSTYKEGNVQVWMLNRPSGDSYMFRPNGGSWKADPDVQETLTAATSPAGWVVTATDGSIERYNTLGRLLSITYRDGDVVSVTYDGQNRSSQIKNRQGRALTFAYVGALLDAVTLPDGRRVRYTYNAERLDTAGYQTSDDATNPIFAQVRYLYEDSRNPLLLTGILDETGQRYASWTYDTFGRVLSSRHGSQSGDTDLVSITYGLDRSWVTGSSGATAEFQYALQFGRAKVKAADSLCATCSRETVSSRTYDANGYLDVTTDFGGTVTDFDYNSSGLETQRIDAKADPSGRQRTTQTDWNVADRVPLERRVLNASGELVQKTSWTYNSRGQELTRTSYDPANGATRVTTQAYCEQADVTAGTCPLVGLLRAIDGPRTDVGDVTTYQYYAADHPGCATGPEACAWRKGDLWKSTNAAGQVIETLRYDGAGHTLSTRDSNNVITDLTYDLRGRLTGRTTRASN